MSDIKQKPYPAEFKESSVKLAIESITEAQKEYEKAIKQFPI